MMRVVLGVFILFTSVVFGQTDFQVKSFKIEKVKDINPKEVKSGYDPVINNLEVPVPGGNSAKSYLMQQKIASKKYYQEKIQMNQNSGTQEMKTKSSRSIDGPVVGEIGFRPRKVNTSGDTLEMVARIPSDNTLAVSNGGIILVGMNSVLYAHDINTDSPAFENGELFLGTMIGSFPANHYFDPKIIYDPTADRFIVVFLKNATPATSKLAVCFSSTNDPDDPWYYYDLPGNPLDNNRWTDFPAISITEDKLYYTANLIIPDSTWQAGFDGSIIWEIDKQAGYDGETEIGADLYHDIKFQDKFIRNIHPAQGASGIVDDLFLFSNRNFDIENDTIFFVDFNQGDIIVNALISDVPYGVPPNARQEDTDTSDATSGLQTNDARVLAAIQFDDEIHFASNTVNPETGFSAIYHGIVRNIYDDPEVSGHIVGDDVRDFGYPNLAWSGNEDCDREVMIGFNYSSFDDYPGVAAVYYNNDGLYSDVVTVQEGFDYVKRLPGTYERWGDYFGAQRKFNDSGRVFIFGYLSLPGGLNSGYCAELISPDSSINCVQPVVAISSEAKIYPNPSTDFMAFQFNLEEDGRVKAEVYDLSGKKLEDIADLPAKKGLNEFSFYVSPLAAGRYILILRDEGGTVLESYDFVKIGR